jgi:hypothetical protein
MVLITFCKTDSSEMPIINIPRIIWKFPTKRCFKGSLILTRLKLDNKTIVNKRRSNSLKTWDILFSHLNVNIPGMICAKKTNRNITLKLYLSPKEFSSELRKPI